MNRMIKWISALAIFGLLAGCAHTVPVANIQTTVGAGHTVEQVKKAIFQAGVEREWIMNEAGNGVIKARQQSRDHVAEVRISYTASGYSIRYDNSLNLSASNGKIHPNYNRWVRNLDKDIQVNLSALSAK